ncbi:hypothetical protein MFRU_065g00040 [Monilinia fructicola]|uniref:PWI domain-containing protein n=1 Tax=Monilinia fructicola TaxID=38448 RepID=A0A5M9J654_MONFR|nr:hypothetical protein EYC84_011153 [Monilinia fructicola]KAG4025131.1 hypothetical protein MFRU_065g00040 [Monilinia fructicola]
MSYNPYGAASPYGRPPGFGGFPGQNGSAPGMGPPPGMAPPPGMSAPGTAPPPGLQQANNPQTSRPSGLAGLPASWQCPPNMPNINFNAPVIRLGTGPLKPNTPISAGGSRMDSVSAGGKAGLGSETTVSAQRQALRDSMMSLVPPTKEEIVRTIFVGGITEGVGGDDGIERILSTAGRLRRWDRAIDASGKECSFGFAQYDDAESLATAVEILKDIEIPTKKQPPSDGAKKEGEGDDEKKEVEKSKLLVFVDDNSLNYLENYQASKGDDATGDQTRLDAAKMGLKGVLYELFHPPMFVEVGPEDIAMEDRADLDENVEEVIIPLATDDELSDIPAEMRETVAQEIAAFRDRSNRRDLERLKREEEMEALERQRNGAPRPSRLASPGPQIPSGPAAGTNNIPLGPRGVPNAPSGPKLQGQQIPRDYQAGVKFVNGSGINGASSGDFYYNREDDDSDASDEELERRRKSKKEAELEKQYLDQERRWLNREKSRTAAVQREKEREEEDAANADVLKQKMAARLKEWDDDAEAARKTDPYYVDRSLWLRNRAVFIAREAAADERDRIAEQHERRRETSDREQARGLADSFLDRQAEELESRSSRMVQQPFKLSLGAAAQKAQKAAPPRRTVAEVEGLLEDEEDADNSSKRTLIPIKFDPSTAAAGLSDEERDQAVRQLAQEIPTEKEGLWSWDVKWDYVDDAVIVEKLRPFVEKKIVEYLGVQEQLLVEVVEEHVRTRGNPQKLVEQLEGALDDEAEVLVKKLWRMVIFFSESEKRGLSA